MLQGIQVDRHELIILKSQLEARLRALPELKYLYGRYEPVGFDGEQEFYVDHLAVQAVYQIEEESILKQLSVVNRALGIEPQESPSR